MTDTAQELDVGVLAHLLWEYRRTVLIGALLGALLFGVVAFTSPPVFRASVVLTPARERNNGNMGALATEIGGLASLAGVDIAPGGSATVQSSAAVLESHHLAEEFIRRNGLLPDLTRASSKNKTLWHATDFFKKNVVTIVKDNRKGTTTVSIEWTDAAVAARWANGYVALANDLVRTRALEDSSRNIAYLNDQLAKTNDIELRRVMYNLVENETKTLMLANGRTEYAFEVVDPAVTPELKIGPHRLIMTIIGFIVGFSFASVIAFLVDRIRLHRQRRMLTLRANAVTAAL
jgi:uncharacterized protein involved in exopolysaccharide biosynthesis